MSKIAPKYLKLAGKVKETEDSLATLKKVMEGLDADTGLLIASSVPGPIGTIADVASLTKSIAAGDLGGAMLDLVGFVPFFGDAIKAVGKGAKIAKHIADVKKLMKKAKDFINKGKKKLEKLCKDKPTRKKTEKEVHECGGGACGAENRASHEAQKRKLRQQMSKPSVDDPELQKITDSLYRPNAQIGSGSTADAIRHERATGEAVGGRFHKQKGEDSIRALEKWLDKNPTASPGDRAAAENVILDLQNSLGY